jgi:purine catabolism regulator
VSVTIASLLSDSSLDLRVATSSAPVDRPVSWVHVSELTDPTPFLDGGELLLTTGLSLVGGTALEAYVDRLVDVGIAALGFGTGLGHDELPVGLVQAAEMRGLAVLEVPRKTPFIAISRSVAAALAAEEYAAVTRSAAAQQELARASLDPGAPGTVLKRLTRYTGGWALLLDAAGSVLAAVPGSAVGRAADLRPELDRLRRTRAPASTAISAPHETVLLQSLGDGARTRAFLALGRPGAVPPADRLLVNAAALLLTLRLEQSHSLDAAMAELRAALLSLLSAGEVGIVAAVAERLGNRLPDEPVEVVTVRGSTAQRAAAGDVVADATTRLGDSVIWGEENESLVLVASAAGPLAGRWRRLADQVPGVAVGVSTAVPWSRYAEGVRQARQAAEQAARTGGGATAFADLATAGLVGLVDPEAARALADALLAPLRDADSNGAKLASSVLTWLAHHGQWEPASAELQVHRHTLRKRIRRVEQLLDRDLDLPGVRAELWMALNL